MAPGRCRCRRAVQVSHSHNRSELPLGPGWSYPSHQCPTARRLSTLTERHDLTTMSFLQHWFRFCSPLPAFLIALLFCYMIFYRTREPMPPRRGLPFDVLVTNAWELQAYLSGGRLTSVDLIHAYTAQVAKYDGQLRAIISKCPDNILLEHAKRLDDERATGKIRGPLHGIPILIKASAQDSSEVSKRRMLKADCHQDNINTHPDLKMGTTCGSLALVGSRPRKHAIIVQKARNSS
jgi:Amidase